MFANLVDFFVYELDVLPTGMPAENLMPLPRGKWAAYHKLAYAIHGRRSPAVIHAGAETITCEVPRLRAAASVVILSD